MPRNQEMELCKVKINERLKFGTISFEGRDIAKESLNIKPILPEELVTMNLPIELAYHIFDLSFIRDDADFTNILPVADRILKEIREVGIYIQERAEQVHANTISIFGEKILVLENMEDISDIIDGIKERRDNINQEDFELIIPLLIQNFKNQVKEQVIASIKSDEAVKVLNDLEEFLVKRITKNNIFYNKINPSISILKDISHECLENTSFCEKILVSDIPEDIKVFIRRYRELNIY